MICKKCNQEIGEKTQFCENCGAEVETLSSENIILGTDGVYRWSYGMNMWKNPTIIITLAKVFFLAGMFPVSLVTILALFENGIQEAISAFGVMFPGMIGMVLFFLILAYPITAILNGGVYQVVFELDNKGVTHTQMRKQIKRKQIMSWITVLAGVATGNPTTAGAGLLAGSKNSSYSNFKSVKKIVAKPKRNVIYVNETLEHNQVYVASEDYEKVKLYIIDHCPNTN